MRVTLRLLVGAISLLVATSPALAHRQWMLPSATVLSGEDNWVTVDAAVSNDLFYFEHQPMRLQAMKAYAPDGSEVALQNASTGRYRSTFDIKLEQKGTYKIASAGTGVLGSYTLNGEQKRLPRGMPADQLAAAIPTGASDVRIVELANRVEIFVTSGEPTTTVFTPTGKGLEMVPVTHPNDLVVGEPARFRFLIDGKPAPDLAVAVIPGGIRYRDQLNEQSLRTDAQGEVAVAWQSPGFHWINAEAQDNRTSLALATERRLNYVATVEVLLP